MQKARIWLNQKDFLYQFFKFRIFAFMTYGWFLPKSNSNLRFVVQEKMSQSYHSRGGGMGKPSKPYGLPDFRKWSAISKYVKYISIRLTVQKLCRLTKIIHFKPPLHSVVIWYHAPPKTGCNSNWRQWLYLTISWFHRKHLLCLTFFKT